MINTNELKEKTALSNEIIASRFKDWEMLLDSANLQTVSTQDFEKYTDWALDNGLIFIAELSHAGRRIRIYAISEEKKADFGGLKYVEISEPKPGKKLKKNEWEHTSFIVKRYDDFLKGDVEGEKVLEKVREIGEERFCYYTDKETNTMIQFRNRSVADSGSIVEDKGETPLQEENVKSEELEKEKALRLALMADFENYRRTTQKKIDEVISHASLDMALKLFDIIDDFDRAIRERHLDEGVRSIYDKLLAIVREEGYEEIAVKQGDIFDVQFMQALSSIPAPSQEEDNKVQEVFQRGYKNVQTGQIVRTAKVIVSKYLPK